MEPSNFSKNKTISTARIVSPVIGNVPTVGSDNPNKPIFLNPAKIRSFIAKIQTKDKQDKHDESHLSGNMQKSPTMRPLDDSKNLLLHSGRSKLEKKLSQTQLRPSQMKKQPKESIHICLADGYPEEADTQKEAGAPESMRYFARRCVSQAKLARQDQSERQSAGQSESRAQASRDFLRTIDNCLSRLALTQRAVNQHKRGLSSIEGHARPLSSSFSKMRPPHHSPETGQQRHQKADPDERLKLQEASPEDSHTRDGQHDLETLIAQNESLRKKISKLRAKVKEESICKEYWHEKFKDLEKRYNSIVLKNVRQKEDSSTSKYAKGDALWDGKGLLTSATSDSNYKLQARR